MIKDLGKGFVIDHVIPWVHNFNNPFDIFECLLLHNWLAFAWNLHLISFLHSCFNSFLLQQFLLLFYVIVLVKLVEYLLRFSLLLLLAIHSVNFLVNFRPKVFRSLSLWIWYISIKVLRILIRKVITLSAYIIIRHLRVTIECFLLIISLITNSWVNEKKRITLWREDYDDA